MSSRAIALQARIEELKCTRVRYPQCDDTYDTITRIIGDLRKQWIAEVIGTEYAYLILAI